MRANFICSVSRQVVCSFTQESSSSCVWINGLRFFMGGQSRPLSSWSQRLAFEGLSAQHTHTTDDRTPSHQKVWCTARLRKRMCAHFLSSVFPYLPCSLECCIYREWHYTNRTTTKYSTYILIILGQLICGPILV